MDNLKASSTLTALKNDASIEEGEELAMGKPSIFEIRPPENFAMVECGVYRSSFPREENLPFLHHLGLKSVLALVPEAYPEELTTFYHQVGIKLIQHGTDGNKWPHKAINQVAFSNALRDVLDKNNHPILIHCNKGKHRTGCLVGVLRKIRRWSLSAICAEYMSFWPHHKSRLEDQLMIQNYEVPADVTEMVAEATILAQKAEAAGT